MNKCGLKVALKLIVKVITRHCLLIQITGVWEYFTRPHLSLYGISKPKNENSYTSQSGLVFLKDVKPKLKFFQSNNGNTHSKLC